ncbi:hypothetical protein FACS18945_2520 [Bacteroidia bacterium]|nr:hypothetical protein FACS18945_2520 [Bacteroidia bacterium]
MAKNDYKKLELTWAGKDAQVSPEPRILLEQADKSYGDFDTGNMLIHGDNLLALKSLEADFAGKIKCIYIDPPFNTGSAFKYYDDGVEHSVWLSLMRDRLEILKDLLAPDGAIFVHIDYNEEAYLKVLCDEIFGRNNFRNTIIISRIKKNIREREFVKALNYAQDAILFYAKSDACFIRPPQKEMKMEERWHALDAGGLRTGMDYELFGKKPPQGRHWAWSYDKAMKAIADGILKPHPKTGRPVYKIAASDGIMVDTNWTDLQASSFNWDFPGGEKNEKLLQRVFEMITQEGDLVLDSFLGSGTTAAVAHKMGRRWIGIELGDHAYTHCIPRLQKVIDGTDTGGISKAVGWTGGGGFKFYELASSLVVKDARGFDIISKEYNGDMLAEAMCKIMGFKYRPDKAVFWKQGRGTEKNWLFTATMTLTEDYLEEIHAELGSDSLLICCGGFTGKKDAFKNISIKKIPKAILEKCEWNKPGYPLPVREDFTDKDFEFEA